MPDELKNCYNRQEKERYSLRIRHRVEQDKLVILYEQEMLRCFNRFSHQKTEQLSFCTIIKDDEVYSDYKPTQRIVPQNNQEQQTASTNLNSNEEYKLSINLNEIRSKFEKLKDDLVKRQLNESDSLYAVQKMDFQSKLRELNNRNKVNGVAQNQQQQFLQQIAQNDSHVPIVHVNSKFELIDVFF